MPSRAYTSFLRLNKGDYVMTFKSVSMPSRAYTSFLRSKPCCYKEGCSGCQCPLGLIPHFYADAFLASVARNLVSMPSRAYTSFLPKVDAIRGLVEEQGVSMPSRAYTSFLRYPFKNLGFMRFPEPVFAGIYQNILTIAVFRAC